MKKLLLALLLLFLCAGGAAAVDVSGEQSAQFGLPALEDGVPDSAASLLPDSTPLSPGALGDGVQNILNGSLPEASGALRGALRTAGAVLAVVVLCAMVTQMEGKYSADAVRIAGVLGIMAICAAGVQSMVGQGQQAIDELQSFSQLLLPAVAAATAAGGGAVSASALYAASALVCSVLTTVIDRLLLPLVYAFLAVSAADAVLGNQALTRLRTLVKWVASWSLKAAVYLFTAYLGLTRVVSGTADAAAVRAAKLAVSTAVPVVGGMVSDASETVLLGAQTIRNSAGVFGLLAVLAICAVPLVKMGVPYLVMKLTAAVSGPLGDKRLTEVVSSVSEAMGLLTGMTGACGFLVLMSCVCSIRAVSV